MQISNVFNTCNMYLDGYGDSLGQYLISKGADGEARNNIGKTIYQGI